MEQVNLREAVFRDEELPLSGILYVPEGVDLSFEALCVLITFEDWTDDDPPEFIDVDGVKFKEFLPVDPFQQVVWNAREQRPDLSDEMLLDAIKYYCEFDAFIDFEEWEAGRSQLAQTTN